MSDVESYRDRLVAMRTRLRRQIEAEFDEVRDLTNKPGEQVHLHTHNADMDVEGLDEAVGISHALERRTRSVEDALARLNRDGDALLKSEKERERLDALLDTEDFADRLREPNK
jgi:hypothetical protein